MLTPLPISKIGVLAENAVFPKVIPPEPLLTLDPRLEEKTKFPIDKVPNACVIPLPLVALSLVIVTAPLTVVLYALTELSIIRSRIPVVRVNVVPVVPNALLAPRDNVPADKVVTPVDRVDAVFSVS